MPFAILAMALYALHQDFWYWKDANPLVFGFLPVGLFYHGLHTLAAAGLMALLCQYAWPANLDDEEEPGA